MRSITIKPHLSREEVAQKRDTATDVRQYQRWQVIWLALETARPLRAEEIGRIVGVPKSRVPYWVFRYNHKGPDGYVLKQQGGYHRRKLTDAQEQAILASHRERAERGEVVVIATLRAAVESTLGRSVGRGFPYRMAHRHKWRKTAPRTEHPRKDPAAQEVFKKNMQS